LLKILRKNIVFLIWREYVMNSNDLEKLKQKNTEILKAEIGALLFNLGKTHVGFNYWRKHFEVDEEDFKKNYGYKIFKHYQEYYTKQNDKKETPFEIDLKHVNEKLIQFFNTEIDLSGLSNIKIKNIIYGDAIKKRVQVEGIDENIKEFVEKVFFGGCENINSGIDKGFPKKQLENIWVSNAFGSTKKNISIKMLDEQRICFFKKLANKINGIDREIKDFTKGDWIEIRNFVVNEIKSWYSNLLSDSRFPVNDVTLWDQAYMTTSLFKVSLAAMILENSKIEGYKSNPREIKWSILGVQYDKLGLAEKALKPYFINWYRSCVKRIDDKVKEIIEIEYALGNEIYRDETGIYFIVPENISGESEVGYNLELSGDFYELKERILNAFKEVEIDESKVEIFENEFLPSIFVTKSSRGTMNIVYLLENSRENFLKSVYSKDFIDRCKEENNNADNYDGLCQVCRLALGKKKGDFIVCDECDKRRISRLNNWIEDINGETIWTGDLQDKNGRIALVTLKFELKEWLNGNMLNTCVINDISSTNVKYQNYFDKMKKTLLAIKEIKEIRGDDIEKYKEFKGNINELKRFIKEIDSILLKDKSILEINERDLPLTIENVFSIDYENEEFIPVKKSIKKKLEKIIEDNVFMNFIKTFRFWIFMDIAKEAYNGCKGRGETIDDFIGQVLLERTTGDLWEDFIANSIIKNKIDFENKKIEWEKLTDEDISFLAEILLQFLIRKNPSPARFRRIWETTEEFLEEVKNELEDSMEIEGWRAKRIIWKDIINDERHKRKEYTYKDLDFWVDEKGNIYLISSIEQAIPIIGNVKKKDDVEKITEMIEKDNKKNRIEWIKNFTLEEYSTNKATNIILGNSKAKYESYLPYLSIIDPTPISWQFIIPAEYLPNVIDKIQEKYRENFKYVVGKLPLHIGVVIQDYKKPLYIGLKALRKIRRDITSWEDIKEIKSYQDLKKIQRKYFKNQTMEETNNPQNYYSLYPIQKEDKREDEYSNAYEFYIQPDKKMKRKLIVVDGMSDSTDESYKDIKLEVYPNTIDFEFLDTNIRRNDIYYENGKRILEEKSNRPYTWEEWEDFKRFKEYFCGDKDIEKQNINKLNNIVSLIYSKIKDWEGNDESLKKLMLSAFVNIFELNGKDEQASKEKRDCFAKLFGEDKTWEKLENMPEDKFKRLLWKFIDMYEFWNKALKKF